MTKIVDDKMFFYEQFANEFDHKMNMYDTNKRIKVIFDELLTENIEHKLLLDAGCGTGWFSQKACERKAHVTSLDLGVNLLDEVAKKCDSNRVVGSILQMPFEDNYFDIVISSEVIEHVPDHKKALSELYRVLKPNGILVITTPNKLWYFAIFIANTFKLRPYEGIENWIGWFEMKRLLPQVGFRIDKMVGIHLFPFIFRFLNPVLDYFHTYNKRLGPLMVNMAIKAYK